MMTCSSSSTSVHRPQKPVQASPSNITHQRRLSRNLPPPLQQVHWTPFPIVHSLYVCPQFKLLSHDKMLSTVRSSNVCLNCLKPGRFSKNCGSNNRCQKRQKPHHTLLHSESKSPTDKDQPPSTRETVMPSILAAAPMVSSHAQPGSGSAPFMTCQMLVHAPDGTCVRARVLLDSDPSTSFTSKRLHVA